MNAQRASRALIVLVLLAAAESPAFPQRWHASTPIAQPVPPLDDLAHTSWTRRDGAPSDISALVQTQDGYLWVGSGLGLYRFDGFRFRPYPFSAADPRLPSSDIATLAASPDGGLWIGYRMGGITFLHGSEITNFTQSSGLISQSTEQITCRRDGSVWAIADGRLMHRQGLRWENYGDTHGLHSEGLYSLLFDHAGNLWTAEKQHVYELKKGAAKFEEVPALNHTVNQFAELPDGTLWISDAWVNARPLWDQKNTFAVPIPGVPVILADKSGSIWLAHDFGGLTRISAAGTAAQRAESFTAANGLTDGQTRAILQDKAGSIWVGTARGLDRFQPAALMGFHAVHLDYFPALLADPRGGIWLNDMDKPLMRFQHGELLPLGSTVHGASSLYRDSGGGVWLLDPISHNFFRYTDDGLPPRRVPQPAVAREVETWSIGEDPQGNLLASFEGHGLWRYSGDWAQVQGPGLPEDAPISLTKRKDGAVWLGYPHNRIVLFDARGFHSYGAPQGLEVNTVLAFYETDGFTFTAGSDGLAFFDGHAFHTLSLRTPNLLRGISGIVKDRRDDLWLNAASGIIHIPAADWHRAVHDPLFPMDFQSLTERDGLVGTPAQNKPTPSAVIDTDGMLWFATSGHLFSVNPQNVHWSENDPNVQLQSVLINGVPVKVGENTRVKEEARRLKSIGFDYIGIDLNAADRVTYQYMLEGQDREWQEAGTRGQAFYTNLSPATYRFRVRAANGTGRWSELQAPLQLVVTPAFYQTRWFLTLCIVLFAAALWYLYDRRVRYLTQQTRHRLEAQTQERLRIARDLHDTLLQGVQGLVLRFHYATEQIKQDDSARDMLRIALSRADQVINEGRDKVRELRSESTQSRELPRRLLELTETLQPESPSEIEFVAVGEIRPLASWMEDEIFSIAREALTNAIRHAEATRIVLELVSERKYLRITCTDNGQGLSPEVAKAGFKKNHYGMLGMRERASKLGCKLALSSSPGAGTQVTVSVPAKRAYVEDAPALSQRIFDRLSLLFHRTSRSH